MAKLKVVVADDHPLMRSGICRALEVAPDIEVVGEAGNGVDVLPLVLKHQPDVVLLDARMPQMDGLSCLDVLRKRHPKLKVIVMSASGDYEHVERAVRRGASGYIVKSINPADLPAAVRQAHEGTVYHALRFADRVEGGRPSATELTERELRILKLLSGGVSNRTIAQELYVTEQTVKFHLTNIYRKIGVTNRTEATRYAFGSGLAESMALSAS